MINSPYPLLTLGSVNQNPGRAVSTARRAGREHVANRKRDGVRRVRGAPINPTNLASFASSSVHMTVLRTPKERVNPTTLMCFVVDTALPSRYKLARSGLDPKGR